MSEAGWNRPLTNGWQRNGARAWRDTPFWKSQTGFLFWKFENAFAGSVDYLNPHCHR